MAYVKINGKKYPVNYEETTHIFAILDRSGSMGIVAKETIDGYNGFIKELSGQNAKVTLTIFDDQFETVYAGKDVDDVPKLTKEVYYPRGWTALIDAVCGTIEKYKDQVEDGDKAIVLIITDGKENTSREYTGDQMKKLIQKLDKRKNWTFTYLGANQDAWEVSKQWGFNQGNVSTYQATRGGTVAAFQAMSVNTAALAGSGLSNSKNFYSDEDKEKLKHAS